MLYLQRGNIAWQKPPGRIEDRYRDGVYLPWDNWQTVDSVIVFQPVIFGEFRKELVSCAPINRK
jgi:hypothetical protein